MTQLEEIVADLLERRAAAEKAGEGWDTPADEESSDDEGEGCSADEEEDSEEEDEADGGVGG